MAYDIDLTNDGGYVFTGAVSSFDGDVHGLHGDTTDIEPDFWIVKLNRSGIIQWQKCIGGSAEDRAFSIKRTKDNGYILAGRTASSDGDVKGRLYPNGNYYDSWIVKLNNQGKIQWQKTSEVKLQDEAYEVQQTREGGYIMAGYCNNKINFNLGTDSIDYFIVKLNNSGSIQWQKTFGGSAYDVAYSIYQTIDNGYIIAGESSSNDVDVSGNHLGEFDRNDYWILKIDSTGNKQWQKCLGGSSSDIAYSIKQNKDGTYIVVGTSNSKDGDVLNNYGDYDEMWIVKLKTGPHSQPIDINLFNPYPKMIDDQGKLINSPENIDTTKLVMGATTDGLSKILLVVKSDSAIHFSLNNKKDGLLSSLDSSDKKDTAVTIIPEGGLAVAVYTTPDGYGLKNIDTERFITVSANRIDSPQIKTSTNIKLITPPVVMVHGMWSNPDVWIKGGFKNYLNANGLANVYLANYEEANAETFDPEDPLSQTARDAIYKNIKVAQEDAYQNGIIVSQVDVIGHSLGGLQARSFCQDGRFLSPMNYNQGYIHKLITIGTPHLGSSEGPILYYGEKQLAKLSERNIITYISYNVISRLIGSYTGMKIGSCHLDFNPLFKITGGISSTLSTALSDEINRIAGTNVSIKFPGAGGLYALNGNTYYKAHAIASRYDTPGITSDDGWFKYMAIVSTNFLTNHLLGDSISDIIVPRYSQIGGLKNKKYYDFYNNDFHASLFGVKSQTSDLDIQKRVRDLLLSDDITLFAKGFPAPKTVKTPFDINFPRNNTTQKLLPSDDSTANYLLGIVSPKRTDMFLNSGADSVTLSLSFTDTSKLANAVLVVENIGIIPIPAASKYSQKISVPKTTNAGRWHFIAVGNDIYGNIYADTLSAMVIGVDTLQSMTVYPSSILLDSFKRVDKFKVTGLFKNGTDSVYRDITSPDLKTFFTTIYGDSIITVSTDGNLMGNHSGRDTILITNKKLIAKVAVKVDSTLDSVTKHSNMIDLSISDKTIFDPPFAVYGTSSSGEEVSCTLLSGPVVFKNGVITIKGLGTIKIKASSPGNAYFNPAPDDTITFQILKAPQYISFDSIPNFSNTDTTIKIHAVASSLLPVKYSLVSGPAIVRKDSVEIKGAGTITIRVTQSGNSKYAAAPSVERTFIAGSFNKTNFSNQIINAIQETTLTQFDAVIYPNPATYTATMKISGTSDMTNISITDFKGKVLWKSADLKNNEVKLPIEPFVKGVYIVVVTNGKECKTIKLVKE